MCSRKQFFFSWKIVIFRFHASFQDCIRWSCHGSDAFLHKVLGQLSATRAAICRLRLHLPAMAWNLTSVEHSESSLTHTISYPIARLETFGNFFFPVSKPSQSLMTGVLPGETLSSWSIQGICVLEEWMGSKQIYINQTSQVESLQVWGEPLAGNCCRLTSCPSDMRQIHSSTLTWTPSNMVVDSRAGFVHKLPTSTLRLLAGKNSVRFKGCAGRPAPCEVTKKY